MRARSGEASEDEDLDRSYRALAVWLERMLAARGADRSEVQDLVQESFIRLGRYGVEDRSRHPRALLLRIASNLGADAARRRLARRGGHAPLHLVGLVGEPGEAPDQEVLVELKRTVLALPRGLRDTFLLARFTPMTNAEIAEHLGISTKTVEWRIKKAVSICLARLEP